jgi:hypothetical protein
MREFCEILPMKKAFSRSGNFTGDFIATLTHI